MRKISQKKGKGEKSPEYTPSGVYIQALINQRRMIILSLLFTHVFDLYPEVYIYPVLDKYNLQMYSYAITALCLGVWIIGLFWCIMLEQKDILEIRPNVVQYLNKYAQTL